MQSISLGVTGRTAWCWKPSRDWVLVDTGLGTEDVRHPFPRLSRLYANMLGIRFDPEQTAVRQLQRLGFSPSDVRHIVLTHLDFDHAGGLEDFPDAAVHLLAAEADSAIDNRRTFVARHRYRPMQWGDQRRWQRYSAQGEPWLVSRRFASCAGYPRIFC